MADEEYHDDEGLRANQEVAYGKVSLFKDYCGPDGRSQRQLNDVLFEHSSKGWFTEAVNSLSSTLLKTGLGIIERERCDN